VGFNVSRGRPRQPRSGKMNKILEVVIMLEGFFLGIILIKMPILLCTLLKEQLNISLGFFLLNFDGKTLDG
jgi:hypothetical protein